MDPIADLHYRNAPVSLEPAERRSSAGLEPFTPSQQQPWDAARVAHLLRRTETGPDLYSVADFLGLTPQEAVDQLIDAALNQALPAPPAWADEVPPPRGSSDAERQAYQEANRERYVELSVDWYRRLFENGIGEHMALFWSNHFVTEFAVYRGATYAYEYLTLLRECALGDFKEFVRKIGLTPAMLIYLDGVDNVAGQPNENYARELLELFTMGIGHYTEDDVKEISRALTGWRFNPFTNTVFFNPLLHDSGSKTIFGRTGAFGYDDVIDLIFQERADSVARFVCAKLYRHLVYVEEDDAVVDQMAEIFLENDFTVEPVVRMLLKSAHFFDDAFYGAHIKSPVQFFLSLVRDAGIDPEQSFRDSTIFRLGFRLQEQLGQILFNPPDVSGWPGHRDWISSASLTERWTLTQRFATAGDIQKLLDVVSDPHDPWAVAGEIAVLLSPVQADAEYLETLVQILLDGIPTYEWDPDTDGGLARLSSYVAYLMQLPEYQLA